MKNQSFAARARVGIAAGGALVIAAFALTAFSAGNVANAAKPDAAEAGAVGQDAAAYSPDSLYAFHADGLGLDFSTIDEVSYNTCVASGCHGAWEDVVASTDALFERLGQISDGNPHYAHATNAYACGDCHGLTTASELVCNKCHIFAVPEGWTEPDKTTTN